MLPDVGLTDLRIITSRRGYEFAPDTLRLTSLSMQPVVDHLKAGLSFQSVQIGTPPPTFGEVPLTIPPGLVFVMGVFPSNGNTLVPIRSVCIEPARIVIDVAGPSEVCGKVFSTLKSRIKTVRAADGSQIIGAPSRMLDSSEVSFRLPGRVARFVDARFLNVLSSLPTTTQWVANGMDVVPSLRLHFQRPSERYIGTQFGYDPYGFVLEVRAGSQPGDATLFSSAPLDDIAHVQYLQQLARAFEE